MDSQTSSKPLRVFLWMVPRTNSTVLTKCMSFVDDTEVWMEPYLACMLNETLYNPEWGVDIDGMKKVRGMLAELMANEEYVALKKQEVEKQSRYNNIWPQEMFSYPWLKEQLETMPKGKKFVFIKDEACAINGHLEYLPDVPTRHTFLIRHPQEVYPSLKNITANYDFVKTPWDEFNVIDEAPYLPVKKLYEIQYNLWKYITKNVDPETIIIDGFDLTSKPEVVLPKYLEKVGIPYKDSYLQWESDPEIVYSSWRGSGEFVFTASRTVETSRAIESVRFDPPKRPRGVPNPKWKITDDIKECIQYSMPFYEEMYANRLN